MITVTLGTINFPFDRLVNSIAALLHSGMIAEEIFVQHGDTDVAIIQDHPLVTTSHKVPSAVLSEYIAQSRLVISHAGQGSTRYLAAQKVSFIIVPRLADLGEHIDDHQLDFAKNVSNLGIVFCEDTDRLIDFLKDPPPPLEVDIFKGPKLSDFLAERYSINKIMLEELSTQKLDVKRKLSLARRLQPFMEVFRDISFHSFDKKK